MRYEFLALLFLLTSLVLYSQAPWEPAPLVQCSDLTTTQVPGFTPPRIEPSPDVSCSYCDKDGVGEREPAPAYWTGMEWQCGDCGTTHLGTVSYRH